MQYGHFPILHLLALLELFHYSGLYSVVGVTKNINVVASPAANQGQVSVPGVALWSFSSVPVVYVNGTAADNDTVTFTGTNNSASSQTLSRRQPSRLLVPSVPRADP